MVMRWDIENGIMNIYKEAGYHHMMSWQEARGIVKTKKDRAYGHTDPDAVGCPPVCREVLQNV